MTTSGNADQQTPWNGVTRKRRDRQPRGPMANRFGTELQELKNSKHRGPTAWVVMAYSEVGP